MAVFTPVSPPKASALLRRLGLGALMSLRGIEGGIENTNYFVTCDAGEYVLTLFERLTAEQLPFYLYLMKHLAGAGIPVPDPQADADGQILHSVCGKPAAVVNKLHGHSQLAPQAVHCAAVGDMLARMHLAGRSFERQQPNLRALPWWNETAPVVLPYLSPAQADLLQSELAWQNQLAQSPDYAMLPRGPVHADLFRDNVMFALNDWCIDLPTGAHNAERADAFLRGYQTVRPLSAAERSLLPDMARAGALRFWISRLWDYHLPRDAALLTPHDPAHFERVLRQRVAQPLQA